MAVKNYRVLVDAVIQSGLESDINYLWTADGKFWLKHSELNQR